MSGCISITSGETKSAVQRVPVALTVRQMEGKLQGLTAEQISLLASKIAAQMIKSSGIRFEMKLTPDFVLKNFPPDLAVQVVQNRISPELKAFTEQLLFMNAVHGNVNLYSTAADKRSSASSKIFE